MSLNKSVFVIKFCEALQLIAFWADRNYAGQHSIAIYEVIPFMIYFLCVYTTT